MGRKNPKLSCPWLSDFGGSGSLLDGDYGGGDVPCTQDKCAVFDTWVNECVFLSIAHALRRLLEIEEKEKKKKHNPTHTGGE